MTIPATLVTGFLGAGKTTFINRTLLAANGMRVAAIVNDFGSINIDAELIAEKTDAVIGLRNGCICCSLQGDLLRTLKQVVTGDTPVDHILIEASGVADPQGIIEVLMDPVVRTAVRLDAVIAVVDVERVMETLALLDDPLWRAQTRAADFIGLAKGEGHDVKPLRERFIAEGKALVFDSSEPVALGILAHRDDTVRVPSANRQVAEDRFVSLEWRWTGDVPPERFQSCVETLAPRLVRAKGIVNLSGREDASFAFNLVGRRATLEPLGRRHDDCQLVFIAERGRLDADAARQLLFTTFAGMVSPPDSQTRGIADVPPLA